MYEYLILHIYKILINFIDNNYDLIHNIFHMNIYKFKSRWDVVKAFLNYYKPYKGLFFIDFGSAIVVGLLELIFPLITSIYIDRLLPTNHWRSEEHTSELQSRFDLVCRLLLEKKKTIS